MLVLWVFAREQKTLRWVKTVLDQHFSHAWFSRHAVLESCLFGFSGTVYVGAVPVAAAEWDG